MVPLFYKGPDGGEYPCHIRPISEETIRFLKEQAAKEPQLLFRQQYIVTLEQTRREVYATLNEIEVRG